MIMPLTTGNELLMIYSQAAIFAVLIISLSWVIYQTYVYPHWLSPLRFLPAAPSESPSLLWGNMKDKKDPEWELQTLEKLNYVGVYKYVGFLGTEKVLFTDPLALTHILVKNPYMFRKPDCLRIFLTQIAGEGLVSVEGDDHKRQRKLMSAAFSSSTINDLLPMFYEQALKVKNIWASRIKGTRSLERHSENVLTTLHRLSLDVIGLGGFGYQFNALDNQRSDLADAVHDFINQVPRDYSFMTMAQFYLSEVFPMYQYLPTKFSAIKRQFQDTIAKETSAILSEKKTSMQNGESQTQRKDLINIIMNAMSDGSKSPIKEHKEFKKTPRILSDTEVKGQMITFLIAGHETISLTLAWILYYLAMNIDAQTKLRDELESVGLRSHVDEDDLDGSQLNPLLDCETLTKLPYLDAVIREVCRLEPAFPTALRQSTEDCTVPLSNPVTLRDGTQSDSVFLPKNTSIFISMQTINRSKHIWGSDANEFRPERWFDDNGRIKEMTKGWPTYSSLLTFLGGTRGCIGYRFAILELKAVTSVLLSNFEFDSPEHDFDKKIIRLNDVSSRPYVFDAIDKGPQMPLSISRIR